MSLLPEDGLPLRLLGGVAIRLRAGDGVPAAFERQFEDLDFACARRLGSATARFFADAGYEPDSGFNALHGSERLVFYDDAHGRKVDVFVGALRMCHRIDLSDRLAVDAVTIPLADLLLTKLQVYELNDKDVGDSLLLLYSHEVTADDRGVNAARVASLCGADWGLWRTITGNLAKCRDALPRYGLPEAERERIATRIGDLEARIEAGPKSRAWRMRAVVGERKRWYELPEEMEA
jgi:hypothetical protein